MEFRAAYTGAGERIIDHDEIIDDYPEDPHSHSCLTLSVGFQDRPVHVVCSPKDEHLAIITAYLPDPEEWTEGFKTRKTV